MVVGFRRKLGRSGRRKTKGSMTWLSMAVDDRPRNSNFRNGLAAFQQSSGKIRVPWTIGGRLTDCELRKLGKLGRLGSKIRKLGRPVHLRTILGLQMARSAQFGKSAAGFAQSAPRLRHRLGRSRRGESETGQIGTLGAPVPPTHSPYHSGVRRLRAQPIIRQRSSPRLCDPNSASKSSRLPSCWQIMHLSGPTIPPRRTFCQQSCNHPDFLADHAAP